MGLFDLPKHDDSWEKVFTTTTDYEAQLVCDRLREAGIPAVVLNKRDRAYGLTIGDLARVYVYVPPDQVEAAEILLDEPPLSDEELTRAALHAGTEEEPGEVHLVDPPEDEEPE